MKLTPGTVLVLLLILVAAGFAIAFYRMRAKQAKEVAFQGSLPVIIPHSNSDYPTTF